MPLSATTCSKLNVPEGAAPLAKVMWPLRGKAIRGLPALSSASDGEPKLEALPPPATRWTAQPSALCRYRIAIVSCLTGPKGHWSSQAAIAMSPPRAAIDSGPRGMISPMPLGEDQLVPVRVMYSNWKHPGSQSTSDTSW